jgi:hypothetical protein
MGLFERIIEARARGRAGAFKYALRNDADVPASIGVDVGHSRHAVAMCPRYGLESFAIEGPLLAAEHNAMGPFLDVLGLFAAAEGLGDLGAAYEALHRLDASQADVTGTAG